jgi:hypothetical protein
LNKLRFSDFVVLLLTVTITVFCTVRIYGKNQSALQFVIQGRKGNWVYPVNQTIQIDIPGPLGNTTIVLDNGKAQVVSSPCVNQTCVSCPPIQHRGQWIACLPNAVFVRVDSLAGKHTDPTDVDAAVW